MTPANVADRERATFAKRLRDAGVDVYEIMQVLNIPYVRATALLSGAVELAGEERAQLERLLPS